MQPVQRLIVRPEGTVSSQDKVSVKFRFERETSKNCLEPTNVNVKTGANVPVIETVP